MKAGDIVRLKSGSPPLLVTRVNEYIEGTIVHFAWFNEVELVQHDKLPIECLILDLRASD